MFSIEKTLSWIVKGGLLLIPFIPLLVTRSMYFPFISGKNFMFRILVELLAFFWVWLMLVSPRFRPKLSMLTIVYSAFVLVLILATLFGISPYKSFWSSFERMEGLIGHLHLFLYFLIAGSVLASARDWRLLFNTSVAASAVVALWGVWQLLGNAVIHQGGMRVDSTLGNATYLGVYLLFHLFIIAILFFETNRTWVKILFAALFLLEAVVLYHTASRGPLFALLLGMMLFAALLAFFEKGRIRQLAVASLVVVLLIPVVFYFVQDSEVVRSSPILERFRGITDDVAIKGRFTIWKMALRGWQERPILGWGQESFTYIFSKYYEPSLWKNEPWFDRAHNVFLDWLTASGILGLGLYLAMYGGAFWLLFQAFRQGRIGRFAFAGFVSLLIAHFFQNLFVFDNITSYVLFVSVLAYAHRVSLPEEEPQKNELTSKHSVPVRLPVMFAALGIGGAFIAYSIFIFNIQPMRTAKSILNALFINHTANPAGKVDVLINELKKGIALKTFGTTELREQAAQIGSSMVQDSAIAMQDKVKYFTFAVEELEKQRIEAPDDVRAMAFIATAYSLTGRHNDAVRTVNEALKISDKRQQFYFMAAEAYLSSNQHEKAVEVLRIAYTLDPSYPEALDNLVIGLIQANRDQEAEETLQKHFGKKVVRPPRYARAYEFVQKFDKALEVWRELMEQDPDNAEYRASLGAAYATLGKYDLAIQEIRKAIELEPNFKPRGEEAIRQIMLLQSRTR